MAITGARLARFIQAWKDFDDEKLVRPHNAVHPGAADRDDDRRLQDEDPGASVESQLTDEYAIVVNLLIEARAVLRDHRWGENDSGEYPEDEYENDDVIAMVAKIDAYFKRVDL